MELLKLVSNFSSSSKVGPSLQYAGDIWKRGLISTVRPCVHTNPSMLGDPGAARRDDVIFSGERCFRAKVYFKRERAFSVTSLVSVSIEKIYQTFKTVFD